MCSFGEGRKTVEILRINVRELQRRTRGTEKGSRSRQNAVGGALRTPKVCYTDAGICRNHRKI
jgi:hypothetical protein